MRTSGINLAIAALCSSGLVFSTAALAHQGGMGNAGYVTDAAGHLILDGAGNCVRTSAWSVDLALAECDPDLVKKPVVAAPPPAAPAPAPMPAPEPVYETVALSAGALFDINKATLKAEGQRQLSELATRIKTMGNIEHIDIAGHTDSSGAESYNQDLSVRRANAVKNFLVDQGVDPKLMSTIGYGETRPVGNNATREGRAQNRRVEVTLRGSRQVR